MKKNKLFSFLLCVILLIGIMPVTAKADTGPKPSVTVTINGLENEQYYATLLSEKASTGPASAYEVSGAKYHVGEDGYDIWKKFVDYEDSDGYYFLQEFWKCEGSDEFRWGYYPPDPFKILLYFPETDMFVVSEIYERYAFDTYYTVNLENLEMESVTAEVVTAEKSYDYSRELVNLAARVVITILLELAIALLFGLRKKRELQFLVITNVVTQVVLNVLLNIINYNKGQYAFVFYYILLEMIVFVIEAVAYSTVLSRISNREVRKSKAIMYALAANAVSLAAGLWLAQVIPGIF